VERGEATASAAAGGAVSGPAGGTAVTAAAIARYLAEVGQLRALVTAAGADPAQLTLEGIATHTAAATGDLAWSREAGAAAGFAGSLLLCPEPAPHATDLAAGAAVAVCAAPRLAMAEVLGRFFAHLAGDREPEYADPASAAAVAANHAWVRNARVGRDVHVAQHVTIGCGGMGYERAEDGRLVRFPQLGGVVIEDGVDVAAHATIQRGALGDTVIRRGAKVGPHANVGHNVDIGEDVLLSGHVQIGGGARIGRGAVVWQSAAIANGVTVGEGAVIGMSAAVRKDVGAGEVWAGNPARKLR
jgi:UDP-3-O-[3-hydroxymyristoyl] glucosamine N-acyltransferase